MDDNVVFLKFRAPQMEDGERGLLTCVHCRNKTYTLVVDRLGDFPLLQCCACGSHIGRMGWSHDDDPAGGVK